MHQAEQDRDRITAGVDAPEGLNPFGWISHHGNGLFDATMTVPNAVANVVRLDEARENLYNELIPDSTKQNISNATQAHADWKQQNPNTAEITQLGLNTAATVMGVRGGLRGGNRVGHGEGVFNESEVQPYQTQKPLYGQVNEASCVAGSCKMVVAPSMQVPEAYIRQAIGTDMDGTHLSRVPNGLKSLGFDGSATYREAYGIDNLKQSVERGETVIVAVRTGSGGVHAIVVDGFVDGRAIIRDPWPMEVGSSYTVPIDKLSEVMLDKAVTIKYFE